ncbi:hypothetical protein CDCA_CDCA03G1064 [Cyanidium caldarium]|uniref:peptidylprolyl isomerase n=1 Tax=Cyanidium caldarium TaxID=2771 RepID=A0AAV9ISB2_CYACA|nr:hypothetical protein CDCA_CDCA03G1064 [Cyanidium caldarium]
MAFLIAASFRGRQRRLCHPLRPATSARRTPCLRLHAQSTSVLSRRQLLQWIGVASAALASTALPRFSRAADSATTPLPFPVERIRDGSGPTPEMGDLVGIRFRGAVGDVVFDDILSSPEPYFMRVGSGNTLRGVEEAVKRMRVGDRWRLTLPPEYAFGSRGRRASPGKRPIPPNATVTVELEVSEIPGRETELLEVTGGEGIE